MIVLKLKLAYLPHTLITCVTEKADALSANSLIFDYKPPDKGLI